MAKNSKLSESLNGFAKKLFDSISASKDENFFISPFSIMTAMTMCFTGSRSETNKQLKELLSLNDLKDNDIHELSQELLKHVNTQLGNDVMINVANKIYPGIGFEIKKDFVKIITEKFQSEVEQLDYSNPVKSSEAINAWVSNKTNNKLNDLVSPDSIDELVKLILVNAIYFKGNWVEKFNIDHTTQEDFHLSDGSLAKVDMMKLYGKKFNVLYDQKDLEATLCRLPYAGESVSMTIILPENGVKLEKVEKQLNAKKLHEVLTAGFYSEKVNVTVPKFKLEYKVELSDHFKRMGAKLPFDEQKSNFSGINEDPKVKLFISQVLHKAVVEVNEEGTEAAAATAVVMQTRMLSMQMPREFFCDRPFIFVIQDNIQKNILFMGKYVRPV
jgi:serpin B